MPPIVILDYILDIRTLICDPLIGGSYSWKLFGLGGWLVIFLASFGAGFLNFPMASVGGKLAAPMSLLVVRGPERSCFAIPPPDGGGLMWRGRVLACGSSAADRLD
jgi:hypothetical protein